MESSMLLLVSGAACLRNKEGEAEYFLYVLRSKPLHPRARGLLPCRLSCDKSIFEYVTQDVRYPVHGHVKFRTEKDQSGKVNHHAIDLIIPFKEAIKDELAGRKAESEYYRTVTI